MNQKIVYAGNLATDKILFLKKHKSKVETKSSGKSYTPKVEKKALFEQFDNYANNIGEES